MKELKKETKIGIVLIIIALLVVIVSLVSYACNHNDVNEIDKQSIQEKENELLLNEILSEGTDSEDINKDEIKPKLNIEITMSDNVSKALGDNRQNFSEQLIDFLIDNDLSTSLNQVTSTEVVTIDYRYNSTYAEFDTNDKQNTIIIVEYKDGKYKFNFR